MELTKESFLYYAAKYYDFRKGATIEEFHSEVARFKYINRLFTKYEKTNELQTRLVLNHIITLYNLFGKAATPMLFMKCERYSKYVKPFIIYLNYLPEIVEYENKTIRTVDIPMSNQVIEELRKI